MWEKSFLTDRYGVEKNLIYSGVYEVSYGAHLNAFFKPFTTKVNMEGAPKFCPVLLNNTNPSGKWGVSSSGLNHYGSNTLYEGHIYGTGLPANLDIGLDPLNIRSLGLRNPMPIVGWGYDTFGYPAPNANRTWGTSGIYSVAAQTPSTGFLGTGFLPTFHGREVPYPLWKAGPVDLRWDQHRGVWTGPQSCYAATVRSTYIAGTDYADPTGFYFSNQIRYDAIVNDGIANSLMVTGAIPVGQRVDADAYKIIPLRSGDFCFIVHTLDSNGRPAYGLWMHELPGAANCNEASSSMLLSGDTGIEVDDAYQGAVAGEPWLSSGFMIGTGLFDGLATYAMPVRYGGTQLSSVGSGQIVIGNNSGTYNARTLVAGSGIELRGSGTSYLIGLTSHLNLLAGVTFPLSLAYGGTGASGKVFVDLTTSQNIGGLKQFSSGVRIASGTALFPSISFISGPIDGLYHVPSGGPAISVSGIRRAAFTTSGTIITDRLQIRNQLIDLMSEPALEVYQHSLLAASGGPDLTVWKTGSQTGVVLGAITNTGWYRFGPTGFSTTLGRVGVTGDMLCLLPTGNGILALTSIVPTGLDNLVDALISSPASGHRLGYASGVFMNVSEVGASFPNPPYNGQRFYRTDIQEWFTYDASRSKWLGELDFIECMIGSAITASAYFRMANSVLSSTVGPHIHEDVCIVRISAGWGGTTGSGTIEIRRDGTAVSSGIAVGGEMNATNKNDTFTSDGVMSPYFNVVAGTYTNPYCKVYYRRIGT